MKLSALFPMLLALLVSTAPALAQTTAQSTPEDRQRFAAIVHKLEHDPLNPGLRGDRSWAVQWLTDVPDVSVTICSDPLGGAVQEHYAHGPVITVQYVLGMGAFIVENPDKANDADAMQLAGVESALAAYRVMRAAEPGEKSPALEKLVALQDRGELPGFVQKAFRKCQASGK